MTASELTSEIVRQQAQECGFELAGVARAEPAADRERYRRWVEAGYAGEMRYLTDRRAAVRDDPRDLLPSARSVICVGRLYHTPWPYSTQFDEPGRGWISRYAWGGDYHAEMRSAWSAWSARCVNGPAAPGVAHSGGYRPAARAVLCAAGGPGVDRQEHLPH